MTVAITPAVRARVEEATTRLAGWLEARRFAGWDPHDALNSPLVRRLALGNRRLGQLWVQAVKASPVNLRPLLGVKPGHNPKAMGLFLASYWRLAARQGGESAALGHMSQFARWLLDHPSAGCRGLAWGYNFDWPNRAFVAPAGTPTGVNTAVIGHAFLDLASTPDLEARSVGPGRALAAARSACDFVLGDLHALPGRSPDEVCFSYTPLDRRPVHNASPLAASLLAATGARTGERALIEAARRAARFTARRQRNDGAWPYGENANDAWVDNFHTGYVLVALSQIAASAGSDEFDEAIRRGYGYWSRTMFLEDGTPKFYDTRVYPVDAHCAAQAVLTFLHFQGVDPAARSSATRTLLWTIDRMQDAEGCFHYQVWPRHRIRIPYIRWVQAWMLRALVEWQIQCPTTS